MGGAGTRPIRTPPTTPSSRRRRCSRRSAGSGLPTLIPEVQAFLETVLGEVPPVEEALDRARALHPLAGAARRAAALGHALADDDRGVSQAQRDPRLVRGRGGLPVAPGPGAARDGGAPPSGRSRRMGDRVDPRRARRRDPLAARHAALARARALGGSAEPGACLAPIVCAGFTDSHYVRTPFETTVYGFFPLRAMDTQSRRRLVHSADERIAVDDLELGVDLFRHVATSDWS